MTRRLWIIGLATIACPATAVLAQQPATSPLIGKPEVAAPPPSEGGRGPFAACRADLAGLCKDAPSGLAGRLQCLKANQDKLSPDCLGAIKAVLGMVLTKTTAMDNAPRPMKACQQDLAALCPDLSAGEAGRIKCLRDNGPKLSPGCSESLKAARAQAKGTLLACEADRARLCGGAGQKPAEQIKCLKEKAAELGSECRQLVTAVKSAKAKIADKVGAAPMTGAAAPPASAPVSAPPAAMAPSQTVPPRN